MAGRGLGTLTLDLVLKIGGFTAGLDKAGRDLDKKTRAMHKRAEEFGRQLGTALKVGFGIGAAAVGLYLKNTIEAEKVQAQLAARIKDTGAAAGRTLQQLSAQADKLQSLTVFDDEAIGEAQAALLVFTNIQGLNFDRTIEAATDLATVMGTDVADAARTLGKALADPEAGVGKLRKAGVLLTEQQEYMVKAFQESGDIASAQTVILDALAGTMGTAAEAARDTLGGALEGLKNAFNNMLEGDSGADGARGAKVAIEQLASTMNSAEVKSGFDAVVGGLAEVAGAAIDVTGEVVKMAQVVGQTFGFIGNEVGHLIDMQKNALSLDVEGWAKARKAAIDEYANFERARKELLSPAAVQKAVRAAGGSAAAAPKPFENNATVTIKPNDEGLDIWGIANDKPKTGGSRRVDHSAEQARERMRKQIEEAAEATKQFRDQLQDMRDELDGPLKQAETDHLRRLAELEELQKEGNASGAERQAAIDAENALYAKRVEAIEKTLNPLAEVVEAQERELALMGLTGAALEVEAIRLGSTAEQWAKYGAAITENAKAIEAQQEALAATNRFKDSLEDTFASILDGSKSAKEAFKDLANSIIADIARVAARKLVEGLFGGTGGATGGGGFLSFLGSLFGGGRASGGSVDAGKFYEVGEQNQPEIFKSGHRTYLIPGNDGRVSPNNGRPGALTVNFHGVGNVSRETGQQAAARVRRAVLLAQRDKA